MMNAPLPLKDLALKALADAEQQAADAKRIVEQQRAFMEPTYRNRLTDRLLQEVVNTLYFEPDMSAVGFIEHDQRWERLSRAYVEAQPGVIVQVNALTPYVLAEGIPLCLWNGGDPDMDKLRLCALTLSEESPRDAEALELTDLPALGRLIRDGVTWADPSRLIVTELGTGLGFLTLKGEA